MQAITETSISIGKVTFGIPFADLLRPLSDEDYRLLKEDIQARGIIVPIVLDENGDVIDGYHRLRIAAELNLDDIPFDTQSGLSEDEKEDLAWKLNDLRRHMTREERQARVVRERKKGKSLRQIADKLGVDPMTVRSDLAKATVENSTVELPSTVIGKDGKERAATRPTSEPEPNNADNVPEWNEVFNPTQEPRQMAKAAFITLDKWNELSEEAQRLLLTPQLSKSQFNETNENIEWARWSWNPVTGCKHDCPYCYARDIANRWYEQKFEPAFLPERLMAPSNTKVPAKARNDVGYKNVFVCSMADLFGRWVPTEWIEAVLDQVRGNPQWNFLFLTKFPIRLSEFDFPDNAWVGTTVDCQVRVKNAEKAFGRVRAKVKWLSCEPLLEQLHFDDLSMFQWIVIGGSSNSSQTPEWHPPRAWVERLEAMARECGVKVYEKTNLLERIREYPGYDEPVKLLPEALKYLPSIE